MSTPRQTKPAQKSQSRQNQSSEYSHCVDCARLINGADDTESTTAIEGSPEREEPQVSELSEPQGSQLRTEEAQVQTNNPVETEEEVPETPNATDTSPAQQQTAVQTLPREQSERLQTLRNHLRGQPHREGTLREILVAANWNVDFAEGMFLRALARARNRRRWDSDEEEEAEDHGDDVRSASSSDHPPVTSEYVGPPFMGGRPTADYVRTPSEGVTAVVDTNLPTEWQGFGIPYRGNSDLERRLTVLIFGGAVYERTGVLISRSEAVLVLGLAQWDLDKALECYQTPQQIRAVLSEYFDSMRAFPEGSGLTKKAAQGEQDHRLALLLTYTNRPDWYSCQHFLAGHQYNIVSAVSEWARSGIPPVAHPSDKPNTHNEGFGRRVDFRGDPLPLPKRGDCVGRLQSDKDDAWLEEGNEFADAQSKAAIDLSKFMSRFLKTATGSWKFPLRGAPQATVKKNGIKKKVTPGAVINYDVEPPHVGSPDWTKLHFEIIRNGKYAHKPWMSDKFNLTEKGENSEHAKTLDWNNKEHIEAIRKWHIQKTTRVTKTCLREAGQRLSLAEKKFLYELVSQAWNNHIARPRTSQQPLAEQRRSFTFSKDLKQDWETRWNAKYAGKTVEGEFEPRRARQANNLINLIKRWPQLCKKFGLKEDATGSRTDEGTDGWPWDSEEEDDVQEETESEGEGEGDDEEAGEDE